MAVLRSMVVATSGLVAAVISHAHAAPPEPGFWLMGYPPSGTDNFVAAVSRNGLVAGGSGYGMPGYLNAAFSWTSQGGRKDWGIARGMPKNTIVGGLDDTGQVVVGSMSVLGLPGDRPFRRVGDGPLENLGILPNQTRCYAHGISGDGSVVVGHAENGPVTYQYGEAFRWTAAKGMQGLGHLTAQSFLSDARAISRDGSTIVGFNCNEVFWYQAFIWTESGGMKALPTLTGGPSGTVANAVNAHGSIVVGRSTSPNGDAHATRWVDGQPEDLASPSLLYKSLARSVNDDGGVIGGNYSLNAASFAFIWTEMTGMLDAKDYMALHGVTVPTGYKLDEIRAMSGDGLTFGGYARNLSTNQSEGFVATIPDTSCKADCDASGELDIDDFICFQTRFAIDDPYADCDSSGQLDIDDFICFQTLFALGC